MRLDKCLNKQLLQWWRNEVELVHGKALTCFLLNAVNVDEEKLFPQNSENRSQAPLLWKILALSRLSDFKSSQVNL